jgi:hypothetical protein
LSLLIRKSWIVFIYAIALSAESIIIEYLTSSYIQISPIMLSAISITSAGIMLLMVAAFISKEKKEIHGKTLFWRLYHSHWEYLRGTIQLKE